MAIPAHDIIDHEQLARILTTPRGDLPVVSLYFRLRRDPQGPTRRLTLKNLVRDVELAIEAHAEFDATQKKQAAAALAAVQEAAGSALARRDQGTLVVFSTAEESVTLVLPVGLPNRIILDRTPYASPLSSLLGRYERFGVVLSDNRRARLFESYLGEIDEIEQIEEGAAAGKLVDEDRIPRSAEVLFHRNLQAVADRTFVVFKAKGFDRLVIAGPGDVPQRLLELLHRYLRDRVASLEVLPFEATKSVVLERVQEVQRGLEVSHERELLETLQERLAGGYATGGIDETLKCLYYGKVQTLVVEEGVSRPGWSCPECRCLFPAEGRSEESSTLTPCPLCERAAVWVPDIIGEAVEFAIISGSKVEHIAHAKEQMRSLGSIGALLRFR